VTIRDFVSLPGSARPQLAGAEIIGPQPADEPLDVTLVLRRSAELPIDLIYGPDVLSRYQLALHHGADPADLNLVHEVMTNAGLEVHETDVVSRRVRITGRASELAAFFGTELTLVHSASPGAERTQHRVQTGELRIPAALAEIVVAVIGLDNRPQARSHARFLNATESAAAGATAYLPSDLAHVYGFPLNTDGHGTRLAILELGGGFTPADLQTYFARVGVAVPSVQAIGVDGASNAPTGDPGSADGEVSLDIEIAGALAPAAEQLVYFAPNTEQGFLNGLTAALHATPTPTALSLSWGAPEEQWAPQTRQAFDQLLADAAALGVTVCAASGDHGSSDGQNDGDAHVDFLASSPHALGCGGTKLITGSDGTASSETVWNSAQGATGGGVSSTFPVPPYQATAGVPGRATNGASGRGVPDVAANADPETGYLTFVDGEWRTAGGTSAVAPLWAALACRLSQALNKPLGLLQPRLYANAQSGRVQPGFRDITTGNNGAYHATPGWDACTGLGVPDGVALLKALGG
jgi:kumamolisin